jgi:hypothetical protein
MTAGMTNQEDPLFELVVPAWPFKLGAIGGAVFAFGAMFLLFGVLARSTALAQPAMFGMTVGSAILATAWLGMLANGRGGLGPLLGNLGFFAAMVVMFTTPNQTARESMLRFEAVVIAILAFAVGHVFVREPRRASIAASISLSAFLAAWKLGGTGLAPLTTIGTFGGLVGVGLSLAFELPAQRLRVA